MENSGERIKRALAIRGMSQAELARATGIPTSGISQYCRGKFRPKQDKIYLMSQVLRVNPAWLMGADVPMEDTKTNVGTKEKLSISQDSDLNLLNSEETDPELRAIFNYSKPEVLFCQIYRLRRLYAGFWSLAQNGNGAGICPFRLKFLPYFCR